MEILEIIEKINGVLPVKIKNNASYRELKKKLISLLSEEDISNVRIGLNNELKSTHDSLKNNPLVETIDSSIEMLMNIYNDNISFSISFSKVYLILFDIKNEIDEDKSHIIEIEVTIDKNLTTWRIGNYIVNELKGYYYNYEVDFYSFNKDGDSLKVEDLEDKKDDDFSLMFGVPLEEARKYRLNFSKYESYINESKTRLEMKSADTISGTIFISPFKITELGETILGYNLETEEEKFESQTELEYEDNFEEKIEDEEELEEDASEDVEDEESDIYNVHKFLEITEKQIEMVEIIKEQLILSMGDEGEFTMSLNLFDNITNYLKDDIGILETTGMFIRKLNKEFTIFYVHLKEDKIIVFPKESSIEEVKSLYESEGSNEYVIGLEEFFNISKDYKLESNN